MYIFDIDGTLSNAQHRVHHINGKEKDWKKFLALAKDDTVIEETASLMRNLYPRNDIVLVTGRSEDTREMTEKWLKDNICLYEMLYMRPSGDHREDAVVKKELYERYIEQNYKPCKGVFEDRSRVVKMWRELGLICYQVCEGDY